MQQRWVHTSPAQQILRGDGVIVALPDLLRALGVRRPVLVTTARRLTSAGGEAVNARLGRHLAGILDVVEPHVPAPTVQHAVAQVRSAEADGLVSYGGGSAVDTAKALAFFAEHEAGMPGAGFADRPLLPHVAIPTTMVGAPFTSSFAMVDPHARRSSTAGGPTTAPAAVLVDTDPAHRLPGDLLAASCAAALAHGLDAAWSTETTPEARAVALAGLARMAAVAPVAVGDPDDADLRATVRDAAILCGRARQNAGEGLQQAIAQLVGARAGIPHAAAHGALLAHTTRFVADAVGAQERAAVGDALGDTDDPAAAVAVLLERLGLDQGLAALGASDEDLDAVARQSSAQRGVQRSPRPVGEADVRALLDDAS